MIWREGRENRKGVQGWLELSLEVANSIRNAHMSSQNTHSHSHMHTQIHLHTTCIHTPALSHMLTWGYTAVRNVLRRSNSEYLRHTSHLLSSVAEEGSPSASPSADPTSLTLCKWRREKRNRMLGEGIKETMSATMKGGRKGYCKIRCCMQG